MAFWIIAEHCLAPLDSGAIFHLRSIKHSSNTEVLEQSANNKLFIHCSNKGKPLSEGWVQLSDCVRVSWQIWTSFCPCVPALAISVWCFRPGPQSSSFMPVNHPQVVLADCFGFLLPYFQQHEKIIILFFKVETTGNCDFLWFNWMEILLSLYIA